MEDFEKYALDRIRMLTAIENALSSGKKADELQEIIAVKQKELEMSPNSKKDKVSHYALRLAYCRTERLRRQFLTSEVQLFKARFKAMKNETKAKFIRKELHYTSMEEEEFTPQTACVTVVDKQSRVEKNVCGEMSFDSADDGMVCIEDPSSETLRWICK